MKEKDIHNIEVVREEKSNINKEVFEINSKDINKDLSFWDKVQRDFEQSKKMRVEGMKIIEAKLRAQREMITLKIATEVDLSKKEVFTNYLDRVSKMEDAFIDKIEKLNDESDKLIEETREKYYNFFDDAREAVKKKWENKPERCNLELKRIDEQEEKRLSTFTKRIEQIEEKREKLFNQTLETLKNDGDIDSLAKKFNLF